MNTLIGNAEIRFCEFTVTGQLSSPSGCPLRVLKCVKFSKNKSCAGFEDFTSATILERLADGSLSIWGKLGLVCRPHLVATLTVEPTKPRLCHDERFLNLWIRDLPFFFRLHLHSYPLCRSQPLRIHHG